MSRSSQRKAPPLETLEQIPIARVFTEMLDVSKPTGYQLIRDGKLHTHVVGTRRYSTHAHVRECVQLLQAEKAPLARPRNRRLAHQPAA
jgi:hypothetical protein